MTNQWAKSSTQLICHVTRQRLPAPIAKGQPIGKLRVWRGENLALELPLQAADDVGRGSMPQRAMDGATELMIGLLRAGVKKL